MQKPEPKVPEPKAPRDEVQKQARQQAINDVVAQIGSRSLPSDYKARIDAAFVRILKDPDSRKIEYGQTTYGSAVCGTVNARNAFGGYTGRQVFLVYFDTTGGLEHLKIYNESEMKTMSRNKPWFQDDALSQQLWHETDVERQLLRQCGN
jgi:hypothetical protein